MEDSCRLITMDGHPGWELVVVLGMICPSAVFMLDILNETSFSKDPYAVSYLCTLN